MDCEYCFSTANLEMEFDFEERDGSVTTVQMFFCGYCYSRTGVVTTRFPDGTTREVRDTKGYDLLVFDLLGNLPLE